jgi:4'-phosphopantetheinyl transferase
LSKTLTERVAAGTAQIEIARIARVLADVPKMHANWLSESELLRLSDIRHPARRAQYLAGHWLVRVLLSRAYGDAPGQWRLLERKSQPPAVHGHDSALRISISHSEDWIAAAVADVAIGIDLEQRPRILDAAIEPLLLNADEKPGELDADALLQRWVAKEAWIKRSAGSALAERLKHLRVQAASRDQADVRIDSHAAFHFGLAIAADCRVQRHCELALVPGAGFAITDLDTRSVLG